MALTGLIYEWPPLDRSTDVTELRAGQARSRYLTPRRVHVKGQLGFIRFIRRLRDFEKHQ